MAVANAPLRHGATPQRLVASDYSILPINAKPYAARFPGAIKKRPCLPPCLPPANSRDPAPSCVIPLAVHTSLAHGLDAWHRARGAC